MGGIAEDRKQLTIGFRLDGAELERTYWYENGGSDTHRGRLDAIGRDFKVEGNVGPGALSQLLVQGDWKKVREHLREGNLDRAAGMLFEILFGVEPASWRPVLERTFGEQPLHTPARYPLRVRILMGHDPVHKVLLSLPWRTTMWNAAILADSGWTFEICHHVEPGLPISVHAALPTLLLVPEDPDDLGAAEHVVEIKEIFEAIAPGCTTRGDLLQVARTREEILSLLDRDPSWDLVYFYGHGGVINDQLRLKIGPTAQAADGRNVRDLAAWLRRRPPRAVFLNGCMTAQGGWHVAARHLLPDVPLVLANVTTAGTTPARRYAIDWLRAWLQRHEDPVRAAHGRPLDSRRFIDWGVPLVYAQYSTWTTRPGRAPAPPALHRAERWLDRDDQRARMAKHALDLAKHPTQRLEAAIAYGAPGDSSEHISEQLRDYIEQREGQRLHVKPLDTPYPPLAPADTVPFARALRLCCSCDARTDLADLLSEAAPLPSADAAPIVWLDWDVLKDRALYTPLVKRWLEFLRDELAPACARARRDIRVIAFLAIEASDRETCEKLGKVLREIEDAGKFSTLEMGFTCLPMLDTVRSSDIRKFLATHIQDRTLVEDLVQALFAKTGGRYEETLSLLERGLAGEWRVLLRELQRDHGPPSQRSEDV